MNIVEVKKLSKSYTYYHKELGLKNSVRNLFKRKQLTKEAVKGISFNVEEGEIVGFLGPNGAGKTTTLKMLSGILFPTDGDASVMGFTPWKRKKEFKKNFSIVMGQKNQLWWDLPANESLHLNKYIYEIDNKEYEKTLDELSEILDVKDLLKVQVRRLSLGERMKMELLASLIHKPKVLFLDEPTIGLDIIAQKKIREFLKFYNTENKTTILLTSHYMNDIEDLCKRSIIIREGDIVYDGELKKINDVFHKKKIIKLQFSETIKESSICNFGVVKEYDGFNVSLEIDKKDMKQASKKIWDELPVVDFNIHDIPVEDAIAQIYR